MVSELITLPLRLGARAARLWLSTAEQAVRLAGDLAEQAVESVRGTEPEQRSTAAESSHAAPFRPRPSRRPSATPRVPPAEAAHLSDEPGVADEFTESHVSSEPTLVEEFAEPGAEDGAGAEIHVNEPWPDYQRMAAKDIVARLEQASRAELAAVQLYERIHRARETVLAAADRRLTHVNGGGAQTKTRGRTDG
jgi:hypothetical protein